MNTLPEPRLPWRVNLWPFDDRSRAIAETLNETGCRRVGRNNLTSSPPQPYCQPHIQNEVPTNDPRHNLAQRRVGIRVGGSRDRNHRRELGVTKRSKRASDTSD